MLVEIVREAAKHVSPELRAAHPGVPFAARTRDGLVHHYFDSNLDIPLVEQIATAAA